MELDLLPVPYEHVILTLPRRLTHLVISHGDALYSKVMQAGGRAILAVGKKFLGAQLAALCVLHTWGQRGNGHVHVHMLMPAGGLTYGAGRLWVPFPDPATFLSDEVLGAEFRDQLLPELEQMHASGAFEPTGPWESLASYAAFDKWHGPAAGDRLEGASTPRVAAGGRGDGETERRRGQVPGPLRQPRDDLRTSNRTMPISHVLQRIQS